MLRQLIFHGNARAKLHARTTANCTLISPAWLGLAWPGLAWLGLPGQICMPDKEREPVDFCHHLRARRGSTRLPSIRLVIVRIHGLALNFFLYASYLFLFSIQ